MQNPRLLEGSAAPAEWAWPLVGVGVRRSAVGVACAASSGLRRPRLFVTEMAEGELDVDSLISRLLEGKLGAGKLGRYPRAPFPVRSATGFSA